jgi:hypothetical protein
MAYGEAPHFAQMGECSLQGRECVASPLRLWYNSCLMPFLKKGSTNQAGLTE